MELQEQAEELRSRGLGAAAVSYDSEEVLAAFAARRGITDVSLLSDDDSSVIRAFGIYNHVAEEGLGPNADDPALKADVEKYVSVLGAGAAIVGTPFPGAFMVDRDGRVTARFFEEFYRERNTAANIMLELGSPLSGIAEAEYETAHLTITASQSNATVTAGSRFHLALDIRPKPGMHVYAPGAEQFGYSVISLTLDASDFIRPAPVRYPPSEIYRFAPLDERVPVYLQPFRLVQEVVFEANAEAVAKLAELDVLTLGGRLDYQACNEKVCFNPVSATLAWRLNVAQLDRQRTIAEPE